MFPVPGTVCPNLFLISRAGAVSFPPTPPCATSDHMPPVQSVTYTPGTKSAEKDDEDNDDADASGDDPDPPCDAHLHVGGSDFGGERMVGGRGVDAQMFVPD